MKNLRFHIKNNFKNTKNLFFLKSCFISYDNYLMKESDLKLRQLNTNRFISDLLYDYVIVLTAKITFKEFKVYNEKSKKEISNQLKQFHEKMIISIPKKVIMFSIMNLSTLITYIISYLISKVYNLKYFFKRILRIET